MMKIVMNAAGGAAAGGGSASPTGDSAGNPANPPQKTVSQEDHQRAVSDMLKYKDQVKDLSGRLEALESKKLEEGNQYKTLWETEKKKREDAEAETKKTLGYMQNSVRHGEVKAAAMGAGLRKEAIKDLDLVDMNDVPVEITSTGRFIVNGVQEKVDRLKAEKPHWFTQAAAPTVNPGGSGAAPKPAEGSGKTTIKDVQEAELKYKRDRSPASKEAYESTYRKYCKDNPRGGSVAQPEGDAR